MLWNEMTRIKLSPSIRTQTSQGSKSHSTHSLSTHSQFYDYKLSLIFQVMLKPALASQMPAASEIAVLHRGLGIVFALMNRRDAPQMCRPMA